MTKTELDNLYAVILKKSEEMDALRNLMREEYNNARRNEVLQDFRNKIEAISKEWATAMDNYKIASERYWNHDYLAEFDSWWRNHRNRDETAPKSVIHDAD